VNSPPHQGRRPSYLAFIYITPFSLRVTFNIPLSGRLGSSVRLSLPRWPTTNPPRHCALPFFALICGLPGALFSPHFFLFYPPFGYPAKHRSSRFSFFSSRTAHVPPFWNSVQSPQEWTRLSVERPFLLQPEVKGGFLIASIEKAQPSSLSLLF